MYDYIKGFVTNISPEYVTIEQQGIGWLVMTPNPYAFQCTDTVQKIYTHLHVRQDTQLLLGFKTYEQRELFKKLLVVSGIGPKGALAILSTGEPIQVIQAIENEDEKYLVQFPGVGKKTARQMILDLKGKLQGLLSDQELIDSQVTFLKEERNHALEEALLALEALGYSQREIAKVRPVLEKEQQETEIYMKQALQLLISTK